MDHIIEPERAVNVVEDCDVLVCGGGPAGIAAALAAARTGARTTLIELHGCLGGVWTAGALSWILEAGQPGLLREITRELHRRGGYAGDDPDSGISQCGYDVETMKLLLEELLTQAGVRIRLHTRVSSAVVRDGRLVSVTTESKSGREAWRARQFVDASGDGDLGALAGCGFDYGHPDTGAAQPMSMMALVSGIRMPEVNDYILGGRGKRGAPGRQDPRRALLEVLGSVGHRPSYSGPTLWAIHEDLYALMATHQYGLSGLDADDLTTATIMARDEVHELVAALRGAGPAWAGLRLVSTAEQIGVREGRRIHGHYTVSTQDMRTGVRHPDAVCRVSSGVDVHALTRSEGGFLSGSTTALQNGGEAKETVAPVLPYDIPLRSLVAKDVSGLLMAGRCVSGDFFAHASYRVTGSAVALGQAAGVAAGMAALAGTDPLALPWEPIAKAISSLDHGASLRLDEPVPGGSR